MKLSFYPYQLTPKGKDLNASRAGALLKMEFKDGSTGYADCHPWIEHEDAPLTEQLTKLKNNQTTRITERSLYFGRLDAMARACNKSLFDRLTIPKSNWLIIDPKTIDKQTIQKAHAKGFSSFKIKVGNEIDYELLFLKNFSEWLPKGQFKLRLDFNLKLSQQGLIDFLHKLGPIQEHLDYIEDPFPFNPKQWATIQKKYKLHLACDFHSHQALGYPEAATFLLIKPAIQDEALFLESLKSDQQLVITSYLDHPVGQLSAAYSAAICKEKLPNKIATCGLVTHHVYKPTPFSEELSTKETRLIPPPSTGIGFDMLLKSLPWTPL